MMEDPEIPKNKEADPAEREAAELGQELQEAADTLAEVDPARMNPEQIRSLVDMVVGVLAAYAGVKLIELGMDVSSGILSSDNPSALAALENLGQAVGSMAIAFPGALVMIRGASKFIDGLRHFMEKLPETRL
jgi:hypothetical protein